MKPLIKLLILDDNQDDINLLLHEIKKEFKVIYISTDQKNEYQYQLATFCPDIVISDYSMPSFTGMEALLYKEKVFPFLPFIIITGSINEETAVQCIKNGADDYIIKSHLERLNSAIKTAIEKRKIQVEKIEAEEKYKNVFENTLVGLYRTTPDGEILLANPRLIKMLGYESFEELSKRNLEKEGFEPNYPRIFFKQKLEAENEIIGYESAWTKKDGTIIYIRESAKAIKDAYGNVKYYEGVVEDVTEHVIAQKKLKESEQRFHSTFDNMAEGCQIVSHDGTFLYINETVANFIRKPKEEIIGKKYFEIYSKVIQNDILNQIEKSLKEKVYNEIEYHHKINNVSKYFNIRIYPVPEGLLVLSKDITDTKKAEETIKEKEKQLQIIFNTANEGICLSDQNLKIKLVNPKFAQLLGYEVEELYNMTFDQLVDKDFYNLFNLKTSERKLGKSDIYEIQLKKKNNTSIWLLVSATPIYDDNGNFAGSFGMFTDISLWKKTYSELIKFYTAIEQSSGTVMITDIDANIEYVNPRFTVVTGYTKEEVIGKNPRILKSGNKSKEEYQEMWNLLTSGKSWSGEFLNKKKNGEYYWEYATISPVIDENGKITNYIGIKDDITERKRIFNELIEAKEKAEEINKIKAHFFANMSHELRTPFVGIMGSAEILAETLTDPDSLSLVDAIIKSSKRLTDTLNKILSLSKVEFNEVKVNKSKIKINETIQEVFKLFENSFDKNLITFSFHPLNEDIIIEFDEMLLRGILINLISNAIKFTPKGKISIAVKIIKESKDTLRIIVSDTGIGIPKDKQEIIFEPFRQASEGYNRVFEGTGLGLTIVKKYVELLSGKISLKSEYGQGSVFILDFPIEILEPKLDIETNEINKTMDNTIYQKQMSPKKLLYVEDDEFSQSIVVRALSNLYSVDLVTNAEDALNKIKGKNYDGLLIDINLGYGMDGVQLVRKIKLLPSYNNKPIIAVTAYASEAEKEDFLSSGFTHYISKPFSIKDFIKFVASIFYYEK
ncbi:MAG: PAS domain S-box protein [Stygiobacter sp.]